MSLREELWLVIDRATLFVGAVMEKDKIAVRVSIGFRKKEWAQLEQAMRVRYAAREDEVFDTLTRADRNQLIRHAVWAVTSAILAQDYSSAPLACDLRPETKEEYSARLKKEDPFAVRFVRRQLGL